MYKRIKMFALLIVIPFIFCGCWDEVLVEKTGFITILGIESAPQGNLKFTYGIPIADVDIKNYRAEILEIESNLARIARNNLSRRSAKGIFAGEIQMILYSKEFAGKGRIVDTNSIFERDSSNAILAWIVVVDGSPGNLIHQAEENFKDKPLTSTYVNALLERAVSTASTIETRNFSYDIISMAPGIDNIAPLIKITEKSIEVKGSALFSNKKMVGTINTQDNGFLMAMMKTLKNKKFTYNTSIPSVAGEAYSEKQSSAIMLSQNSKKIKISIQNNKPIVDIYLDFSGYADEYKWDNLNDEKEIKKLNEHVQLQIQQDCQKLIGYMQKVESDPIGIGDMVRGKNNSYFEKVDWHKSYKEATITVHVKFNLVEYGNIQ